MEQNDFYTDGGNIENEIKRSNSKPEEIIADEINFDTRKGINRSDKVVDKAVIDEIESKGITLERMDELDLPIFKYQTQITIHGKFTGLTKERVGGYKNLVLNGNETLGVRYNAIDYEKKKTISKVLRLDREFNDVKDGFGYRMDSKGFELYKRKVTKTKEEALKLIDETKEESKNIPSNFIGKKIVNAYQVWGQIVIELLIDLKAIKQDNLWSFISALTNGRIGSQESFNELLEKERIKEEEREKIYKKNRLEEQDNEQKLLNELKEKTIFPKIEKLPTSDEFIVAAIVKNYFGNIKVYYVFRNKTGRKVYSDKDYKDWSEIQTTISDEIRNSRGNKLFESVERVLNGYIQKGNLFNVYEKEAKQTAKPLFKTETPEKTFDVNVGDTVLLDTEKYQLIQSTHTKTGDTIYLFRLKSRVDRDNYKKIESNVKAIRGYYSSFVTAFVLKSDITQKEADRLLLGSSLEIEDNNNVDGGLITDNNKTQKESVAIPELKDVESTEKAIKVNKNNWKLNEAFENIETHANELIRRLGGKVTYKSPSGSVYIELSDGEILRVSDHQVDTYNPQSSKNIGTNIGLRGSKVSYNIDLKHEYNIDKTEEYIRSESENPDKLLPKKSRETNISELYHSDKEAGKETELTKAVEALLDNQPQTQKEGDVAIPVSEGVVVDNAQSREEYIRDYYTGVKSSMEKRGNWIGFERDRVIESSKKDLKAAKENKVFDNMFLEEGYQQKITNPTEPNQSKVEPQKEGVSLIPVSEVESKANMSDLAKELSVTELTMYNRAVERSLGVDLKRTIEIADNIAQLEGKDRRDNLAFFAEALQYTISDLEDEKYERFYANQLLYIVSLDSFGFEQLERAIEVGAIEGGEVFLEHIALFKQAKNTFDGLENKSHKVLLQDFVQRFIIDKNPEKATQQDYIWMAINDLYKLIYFAKGNENNTTTLADYTGELINKYQNQSETELNKLINESALSIKKQTEEEGSIEYTEAKFESGKDGYGANIRYNKELIVIPLGRYETKDEVISRAEKSLAELKSGDLGESLQEQIRKDATDEENKLEGVKINYPIVLEKSEGLAERNIGFDYLYELEKMIKKAGVTNNPSQTYIKNKVWFKDYPNEGTISYVTIYGGHNDSDYNPETDDLMDYLKEKVDANFDWSIYEYGDKYKFGSYYTPEPKFKDGDLVQVSIVSEDLKNINYEYGHIKGESTFVRDSEKWKPHHTYNVVDMFDDEKNYNVMEGRLSLKTEQEVKEEFTQVKIEKGLADLLTKNEADELSNLYIISIDLKYKEYIEHNDNRNKYWKERFENEIWEIFYAWFSEVICRYPLMLTDWLNLQVEKLPNYKDHLLKEFVDVEYTLTNLNQFFNSLVKSNIGKNKAKGLYELLPEGMVYIGKLPKQLSYEIDPSSDYLVKIMKPFFSNDDLRPIMASINFDNNGATSTDAHRLMFIKGKTDKIGIYGYGKIASESGQYAKRSKYLVGKKDMKYPKYEAVIPTKYSDVITLNREAVEKIIMSLKTLKNVNYYGIVTEKCVVSLYKGEASAYNIHFLIDLFEAWLKIGFEKLEVTNKTLYSKGKELRRNILIVSPDIAKFTNGLKGSGSILMAVNIDSEGVVRNLYRGEMYIDINTGIAQTAGVTDDLFTDFNSAHGTFGAETESQEINDLNDVIELMEETVKEKPNDIETSEYLELLKEKLSTMRDKNKEKFEFGGKMVYNETKKYNNGGSLLSDKLSLFDDNELNNIDQINVINNTLFYRYYPVGVNPFELSFEATNKYGYGIYFLENSYYYKEKFKNGRLLTIKPRLQNPLIYVKGDNTIQNSEYIEAYMSAVKNDDIKTRDEFTRKMADAGFDSLIVTEHRGTYLVLFSNDPDLYDIESDVSVESIDYDNEKNIEESIKNSITETLSKYPDLIETEATFLYNNFKKTVLNGNEEMAIWITSDSFKGSIKKSLLKKNYIDDYWIVFNKPMSYDRNEYALTEKGKNFINDVQSGFETKTMAKGGNFYKGYDWGKKLIRAIVINEGILYAVESYMSADQISDNEKTLKENWSSLHDEIKNYYSLFDKEKGRTELKKLSEEEGAHYIMVKLLRGDDATYIVSDSSDEIKKSLLKIDNLFLQVTNELDLDRQGDAKMVDGGGVGNLTWTDNGAIATTEYNGETITKFSDDDNLFMVEDYSFTTIQQAMAHIDGGKPMDDKTINAYKHGAMAKGGTIGEDGFYDKIYYETKIGDNVFTVKKYFKSEFSDISGLRVWGIFKNGIHVDNADKLSYAKDMINGTNFQPANTYAKGGGVDEWIGKKVKRKNLRNGYNHYEVKSHSNEYGYFLKDIKGDTDITATTRQLNNEFELDEQYAKGGDVVPYAKPLPAVVIEDEGNVDDVNAITDDDKKTKKIKTVREIELIFKDTDIPSDKISSSKDSYDYFWKLWDKNAINIQEEFIVLYLDRQNKIKGYNKLSKGGIAGTVVDSSIILATASKALASGVIVAHNHPSGNIKPSDADIKFTKQLKEALKLVSINLLDSQIIVPTEGSYYSMADEGFMYKDGGNISYGEGGEIDNPRALGTALKQYFKKTYDIDIDTRYIKTVRGLDRSWYEISTFSSKQIIPNEVRKELLVLSYGKTLSELNVGNPDDISYGNVRGQMMSVYGIHWKEWLKSKN